MMGRDIGLVSLVSGGWAPERKERRKAEGGLDVHMRQLCAAHTGGDSQTVHKVSLTRGLSSPDGNDADSELLSDQWWKQTSSSKNVCACVFFTQTHTHRNTHTKAHKYSAVQISKITGSIRTTCPITEQFEATPPSSQSAKHITSPHSCMSLLTRFYNGTGTDNRIQTYWYSMRG